MKSKRQLAQLRHWRVRKKVSGTYYDFTVGFSRDGSSLGQSAQSCSDKKLSDCTDQLVLDVKSVAGPR